jgi:formamidopyrimidine-DNA glycosylase
MPELPEVEAARAVIERAGLDRPVTDVDDSDGWVCRPHPPGQIRGALVGHRLVGAHRRGKALWCDTSPTATGAPVLGIHLGMSGKIVIAGPDGTELDGGDYWERGRQPGDYRWARFSLTFADGGRLLLVDPRRLGRIRLDPAIDRLGPDATTITPAQWHAATATGTAPIKARLLDQTAVAGIGNLLADEILWLARVHPARPVGRLTGPERTRILRALRRAVSAALDGGGVHTLTIVGYRHPGASCPRDRAPMARGTVGGRTSWWCTREQPARA